MYDIRCPISDVWNPWFLMTDVRYPMSHVRCSMCMFDIRCVMYDVRCLMSGCAMSDVRSVMPEFPLSDALRPADVWCAMSDVRFLMSDVRLSLFDVFVYSKLEQNLPGQAKCEPTVVFLVELSAELCVNAYLCRGNIQWVKANLLKQYHCYTATTQTEDLERLSNHIFLKTKHSQGFVCKRTSVAEWLEFWNCNSEAPNLRPALTAGQLDNWFPSCHLGFFSQVMFHLIRPFVLIDHVLNLR